MTDQLSTVEAEHHLGTEVLQRLETCTPKRRVGSALIYSNPAVSSPGRRKLTHTPTHADSETYCWVTLTNQLFRSKHSHVPLSLCFLHISLPTLPLTPHTNPYRCSPQTHRCSPQTCCCSFLCSWPSCSAPTSPTGCGGALIASQQNRRYQWQNNSWLWIVPLTQLQIEIKPS